MENLKERAEKWGFAKASEGAAIAFARQELLAAAEIAERHNHEHTNEADCCGWEICKEVKKLSE